MKRTGLLIQRISAVLMAVTIASCASSPLGRKQLTLLPEGQMSQMGVQAFDQMKGQIPVEKDASTNQYVQCIAAPLVDALGENAKDWEVVVFKDESANAFALPGKKIGVHTGLLKVAKNEDQLAAVIGHEVGHVQARHSNERVSQGFLAQGGILAAGLLAGDSPNRNLILGLLGVGTQVGVLLPHSRTQESEADIIGLQLMAKAGFDPRQSVDLWKNMMAASGGQNPPEFLSTHPSGETRIEQLQAHMDEVMPVYQENQKAGRAPKCAR